jgi:hypothetical protein
MKEIKMFRYGWAFAVAALYILGFWWIGEMLKRFGRDVAEIREGGFTDKAVVVGVWTATLGIAAVMVWYGVVVFSRVAQYF